jgi:hypothetical protein
MEPVILAIATIFFTKVLEKSGEMFSEGLITKMGKAITKIGEYSPETAKALESGDAKVLNLDATVLKQIQPEPIFAELVAAADKEENQQFQAKLEEIKAIAVQNPNKLAEKIGIVAQSFSTVNVKEINL